MVPGPGGSGSEKPLGLRKSNFQFFPQLKCLVLQREASRGPNHHPEVARIPLLQHIYIYIYISAVKLLSGPSLGVFGSYYLVQVGFLEVIIWSKFVFLAYKNSGFKRFVLHTQLSFCVFFCPQFSGNFLKIAFFQKKGAKIGLSNFQCFKFKF